MNKTERSKEVIRLALEEETIEDVRGVPVKEASINLGLAILMALAFALHLGLTICQVGISFLLLAYDLITKGIGKFMEKVKIPVQNAKG